MNKLVPMKLHSTHRYILFLIYTKSLLICSSLAC